MSSVKCLFERKEIAFPSHDPFACWWGTKAMLVMCLLLSVQKICPQETEGAINMGQRKCCFQNNILPEGTFPHWGVTYLCHASVDLCSSPSLQMPWKLLASLIQGWCILSAADKKYTLNEWDNMVPDGLQPSIPRKQSYLISQTDFYSCDWTHCFSL